MAQQEHLQQTVRIDDDFGGGGGGGGTTITTYKTCPNCGRSVLKSKTSCPNCGYNFNTGTVPSPDVPDPDLDGTGGDDTPSIINPGAGTVITSGGNTVVGMNSVGKGTSLPTMRAVKVTSAPTASYSDTDDELVAKAYSQTTEVFPYTLFGVYDDDYIEHLGLSEYTLYPTHTNIGVRLKFWKFIHFLTGLKYTESAEGGIKEENYNTVGRAKAPINPLMNVLSLYDSVGEDRAKETAVRIAVSFDCGGHSSGEGATPVTVSSSTQGRVGWVVLYFNLKLLYDALMTSDGSPGLIKRGESTYVVADSNLGEACAKFVQYMAAVEENAIQIKDNLLYIVENAWSDEVGIYKNAYYAFPVDSFVGVDTVSNRFSTFKTSAYPKSKSTQTVYHKNTKIVKVTGVAEGITQVESVQVKQVAGVTAADIGVISNGKVTLEKFILDVNSGKVVYMPAYQTLLNVESMQIGAVINLKGDVSLMILAATKETNKPYDFLITNYKTAPSVSSQQNFLGIGELDSLEYKGAAINYNRGFMLIAADVTTSGSTIKHKLWYGEIPKWRGDGVVMALQEIESPTGEVATPVMINDKYFVVKSGDRYFLYHMAFDQWERYDSDSPYQVTGKLVKSSGATPHEWLQEGMASPTPRVWADVDYENGALSFLEASVAEEKVIRYRPSTSILSGKESKYPKIGNVRWE